MSENHVVPLVEDTPSDEAVEASIAAIANEHTERATAALQTLVRGLMEVVNKVDESHDVGDYLEWIRIICRGRNSYGQGAFRIEIEDRGGVLTPEAAAAAVEAAAKGVERVNGRPARVIQLTVEM